MATVWKYVLFLVWLAYILFSALLLFSRGFFLSRDVLNLYSSCKSRNSNKYCDFLHNTSSHIRGDYILDCTEENVISKHLSSKVDNLQYCLNSTNKVIILIIDALRFDFIQYDNNYTSDSLPYKNKLIVVHNLLSKYANSSRLYKFVADPPTTTMQRLNALTTGSLPTFIDIGSNFATSEINEDNLIDQIVNLQKKIVFMGDDTWTSLYPKRFSRQYPFPSFNVWDLDSVDNGIKSHLIKEISRGDWNVIIAHYLGVDHCGHRYGPVHREMTRKLLEMNQYISEVVAEMDNETVLFVIGDHGMTRTGDHGGESEDEVMSAMFVYAPNRVLVSHPSGSETVRQIDLVPTLATILGVPIPFSNVGRVIVGAVPVSGFSRQLSSNWEFVTVALWTNIKQITLYIQEYSKFNDQFPVDKLFKFTEKYKQLRTQLEFISSEDDLKNFILAAEDYLQGVREMCEEVWVQFDSFSMSRGLLLFYIIIVFVYILVEGIPGDKFQNVIEGKFLIFAYGGIFVSFVGVTVLVYLEILTEVELNIYFATCLVSVVLMAIVIVYHWKFISGKWHNTNKVKNKFDVFCRILIVVSVLGLFSNSFVIEEASLVSFLFVSLIWTLLTDMKADNTKKSYKNSNLVTLKSFLYSLRGRVFVSIMLLSLLLRFSACFRKCREEHGCVIEKQIISQTSQCLITIVLTAVFITVSRFCLRSLGNLVGFSPTVFVSRYAPTVIVICSGGFWILQSLPRQTQWKLFEPWQLQILPRTSVFIALGAIVVLYIRPLSIYCMSQRSDSLLLHDNIIPTLFKQLKELLITRTKNNLKGYPVVFGLATAYSAAFINLSIFLILFTALLLGDQMAVSSLLLIMSLGLLTSITAIVRQEKVVLINQLFEVPWWCVIFWGLSTLHFFYATGHQAAFTTLHWNSAFLLSAGRELNSHIMPGILVIANTFCTYIIHSMLLPVLVIAPYTLYAVAPKLAGHLSNSKRAELLLFEQDSLMYRGLFNLSIRYYLFFGFRVFACMLSASIHARHLMVWKIFAPKLIFEGVSLFVVFPSVLAGFILVQRITYNLSQLLQQIQQ